MLSIQPNFSTNYKPAFKMNQDRTEFEFDPFADEASYNSAKAELEDQKDEFESLVKDKELNLPNPAKKLIKGGAVVTGGILGGMATGWGAKKSIAGMKALNKAKAVVGLKSRISKAWGGFKKVVGNAWKKITASKFYTTQKARFSKIVERFADSKIGKPIVRAYNSVKGFVNKGVEKVKTAVKWVFAKIKSVKSETYEKAAVNTVGVSGGIASGVTALKDQSEKDSE